MIYTSRYANPELTSGRYTVVRISVGQPRWVKYHVAGWLKELTPFGLLGMSNMYGYEIKYREMLDAHGVDLIDARLREFETASRPVVLCCYEDIRRGGEYWCHRTMFADWWKEKTGEVIEELSDPSEYVRMCSPEMDAFYRSDTPLMDLARGPGWQYR